MLLEEVARRKLEMFQGFSVVLLQELLQWDPNAHSLIGNLNGVIGQYDARVAQQVEKGKLSTTIHSGFAGVG